MSDFSEDHITSFRDAMAKEGIVYNGPIDADGHLHRFQVEGDAKGKRNGFYTLYIDEHPAGVFGCNRRFGNDHKFHWTGKGSVRLTPEERKILADKAAASRAAKVKRTQEEHAKAAAMGTRMWDAAAEAGADHPYLVRKGIKPLGARVGDWIKERRDGTTYVAARNALLIKIKDGSGLVGLQAIFGAPQKMGEDLRDKDFIYGQKKRGAWTTIGTPTEFDGTITLLVCEGFATGGSLHEATGLAVVPAFDAGNLINVARELRRLMPGSRIVICGDNDQWTERPIKNPGLTRAKEAALAVGGEYVVPAFADLEGEPTDFNDLHAVEGLGAVAKQVMAVLRPPAPPTQEAADYGAPGDAAAAGEPSAPMERTPHRDDPPVDDDGEDVDNRHFSIRGHDRTKIYIYQHEMKMIVARGMSDWSDAALTSIATLDWWETNFPGTSGFDKKMAVNWLQRTAFRRGYFDPDTCRGRGAWVDDGRIVFHFGHKVMVDGTLMEVTAIDSAYVYEQGRRLRLPADEEMSSEDGRRIFDVMKGFSWSRPASAILLAGWAALAPVSGALRWRPHVWLTGGAGSGKSTILNLVDWLMNGSAIFAQGNSTEAGIRQRLKSDALPVMFDESEQNTDREEMRVQAIISLIRQASTESAARTLKGTQGGEAMDFMIRSMFCLSSIQVGMKHQADMERISVLALKPKRAADQAKAAEAWAEISGSINKLKIDADLPARMLRRAINLLPTTIINIEIFGQAAAEKFGSQRDGDQYGTLLAGAWSLISNKVATIDEARNMIARYDWSDYLEGSETEESEKALNALTGRLVRVANQDVSLFELISRAALRDTDMKNISIKEAEAVLKRHGVMVRFKGGNSIEHAQLLVAYKHEELDRLMAGTAYAADLKGQLLRVPGAARGPDPVRFLGVTSRVVELPLAALLDGSSEALSDAEYNDYIEF